MTERTGIAAAALATLTLLAHASVIHIADARGGKAAQAQTPDPAAKPIPLPADAIKRLKSGDAAQIKSALDDVRTSGKAGAAAAPAVVDLLRHGLSPELTRAALDTLGDTESEGASETVAWYARDRDPDVRRTAVQVLAKTRGPAAMRALRSALSDPDPAVRGLAATGLGLMKATDAVGDLFVALDHEVPEAAASIGVLCAGNECERLASKLGSMPFDVVTGGLDQVLFRPTADVSDDLKVRLVGRLRELATAEAHRFLLDVQSRWPAGGSQRVKQSIDQAVLATGAPSRPSGDAQ